MLGTEFTRTVRSAQAGDAQAFTRLWRDANPVLVRYLRVVGHDDPYDGACEGWVTVLRGLPAFRGDEAAWWVWLLQCARMRAQEGTLRRAWGTVSTATGPSRSSADGVDGAIDPLDLDDLYTAGGAGNPRQRGLGDSLAALRSLPLGQGEVLVIRLGAKLSVAETGQVVQSDDATVRRLEDRGLERLGVDRELLCWSLDAPSSPAELADERVALGRFRAMPVTGRRGVRTVAAGGAGTVHEGRSRGSTSGRGVARHSRAAAIAIAATSASVVSLGGLTAAAYVGVLPEPVQEAMHRVIGAPSPAQRPGAGPTESTGVGPTSPSGGASGHGPDATSAAVAGLCRAWGEDRARGVARDSSTAFRNLTGLAGGAGEVDAYCAHVLATVPRTNAPNPSSTRRPAATRTGVPNPSSTRRPAATRTGVPNPSSTRSPAATKAPGTDTAPRAADPTGAGSQASRTSGPRTTAPKASSANGSTSTGSGAKATGTKATGR